MNSTWDLWTKALAAFIATMVGAIILVLFLAGCDGVNQKQTIITSEPEPVKVSFIADFYDNQGAPWFSVEGSRFDISPNKVKEYAYDSDGDWISSYTTSSIVSVNIDGRNVESCGSTITFADTRLKKYPITIPKEVNTVSNNSTEASISSPRDLRFKDYWDLNWWWKTKDAYDYRGGSKVVVVQSQEGAPICMYSGNNVIWEVSRNLPKTTEITIDGMKLYVHRANFAILDTALFN